MTETQSGSGAVLRAKEYLKSVMEGKPPALHGPYDRQIAGLYDRIVNRTAFGGYGAAMEPPLIPADHQAAADEQAFQQYLRRLHEAARDGTEVDPWPI